MGCHRGSWRTLGRPADKRTRAARREAHEALDQLWRNGRRERSSVYRQLAAFMGIPVSKCHIGRFSVDQCEQVFAFVSSERKERR